VIGATRLILGNPGGQSQPHICLPRPSIIAIRQPVSPYCTITPSASSPIRPPPPAASTDKTNNGAAHTHHLLVPRAGLLAGADVPAGCLLGGWQQQQLGGGSPAEEEPAAGDDDDDGLRDEGSWSPRAGEVERDRDVDLGGS